MRIGRDRRRDEVDINVIALIDVLLSLLMFFVLTTTFVHHHGLQVSLPKASVSASDSQPPLVVMVDRDGHTYVNDTAVSGQGLDALKAAIAAVVGTGPRPAVRLQADAMATHQDVVTVMDALGQLGFSRLSIATTNDHSEHR